MTGVWDCFWVVLMSLAFYTAQAPTSEDFCGAAFCVELCFLSDMTSKLNEGGRNIARLGDHGVLAWVGNGWMDRWLTDEVGMNELGWGFNAQTALAKLGISRSLVSSRSDMGRHRQRVGRLPPINWASFATI